MLRSNELNVIVNVGWQNKSKMVPELHLGTTSRYMLTKIRDLMVVLEWKSRGRMETAVVERVMKL